MSETVQLQAAGAELAAAVTAHEYNRLLQLPRDRELEGDMKDRADEARAWYAEHGKPFVAARRVELDLLEIRGGRPPRLPLLAEDGQAGTPAPTDEISAGGVVLHSLVLARRLQAGEAHALMLLAATAGTEVASEAARLWADGRPDEGYFLDRFAVAVTERLIFWASATLCRASEAVQETLLPHLSPGCGNWDIADQHRVWSLLAGAAATLGPIRILETGALDPQHSVLAALGVTHRSYASSPEQLCRSCDLSPCAFRRASFAGDAIRPMIAMELR